MEVSFSQGLLDPEIGIARGLKHSSKKSALSSTIKSI